MHPLRTEAIQRFLKAKTHVSLANLYTPDMEVQVNVAQENGQRCDGEYEGKRWLGWTDGLNTWKPFRIPRNANTEPVYDDYPMGYDLDVYAEGIGMTGWDWKNRLSRWVAYDFDAITGHSDRHTRKLSAEDLESVKESLRRVPWATLRLSTSGKGLHLYVHLTPTPTANHTEHAAVARAVLHLLSGITGCDFNSKVDVCGGNMWVWHRKMIGTQGLSLNKQGIMLDTIPANWRDHINVTSGKSKRNLPKFVESLEIPEIDRVFNELTGQRNKIQLDNSHKELFTFLDSIKAFWWWDSDHHMLVTHTSHLKEAHDHFGYKGQFDTIAHGTDRGSDHNCFAFPLTLGAWAVRRYSPGTTESRTWNQDGKGWTRCFLNREFDLTTSARTHDAVEHPSGGWAFREARQAQAALLKLGADIQLPPWILNRSTKVKAHPREDSKVVVEIPEETHDNPAEMIGWLKERRQWKRVFVVNVIRSSEPDVGLNTDDVVRHIVNPEGVDHGWIVKSDNRWNHEPLQHVMHALTAIGMDIKESKQLVGAQVFQPWRLMNIPFSPEYPGDRQWNRDAAQLKHAANPDTDNLSCPTWMKILNHIGQGLNDAIKENTWCIQNGIVKGSEYLKCWIASLFKEPTEPLPYLFLWGDQNCGKSIFHESMSMLLTKGFQMVDHALISQAGFNGEMENAVLCIIEEINLKSNIIAYNRIKDWVTSKTISIHRKSKTPYLTVNHTHFVQCANEPSYCPIFPGDTRITMIHVKPLEVEQLIPKKQMLILLEKEAPDFLAEVLRLELPLSNDRLNIPVIRTADKVQAEESNESELETFIKEVCHYVPGKVILVSEMWDRFREWLDPSSVHLWTKVKMGRAMPNRFPKGTLSNSPYHHYSNISFEPGEAGKRYVNVDGVLRLSEL